MVSRKSIGVVLVVGASVRALALAFMVSEWGRDTGTPPVSKRMHVNVDAGWEKLPPGVHSKITPPADILVEVIDAGAVGGPVTLAVHAASLVPVHSASISIKASEADAEPEHIETLWSSATAGFVAETVEYTTAPLPAGTYRFTAIFEFVPDREEAAPLVVAESLCLNIRPDTVLSSAVSFDHIKRVELMQELADRGPNVTGGKVAQIKTTHPDVARRISELNRIEDKGGADGASTKQSVETDSALESRATPRSGRPAPEVAVPVRERIAQ